MIHDGNCTRSHFWDDPSADEEHAFVLLAACTATLGFMLNLGQLLVIAHQKLLRRHKSLVVLHLCVCGQLSSASVLWYLYRVVSRWREVENAEDDYLLCFLLPSGLHLLTMFTFAPLLTLLLLQQQLASRKAPRPRLLVALLVVLAWCQALIISLVPLTGWNEWNQVCSVPWVWSPSFALLVVVLYFLHYPPVLILLADLCLRPTLRRGSVAPLCQSPIPDASLSLHDATKEMNIKMQQGQDRPRSALLLFLLYAGSTLPFVCQVALAAASQRGDLCRSLVANERAAMWSSWLVAAFAALRPLVHVIAEEEIGDGTAAFVAATVCSGREAEP